MASLLYYVPHFVICALFVPNVSCFKEVPRYKRTLKEILHTMLQLLTLIELIALLSAHYSHFHSAAAFISTYSETALISSGLYFAGTSFPFGDV